VTTTYLDYAATTPVDGRILEAMLPYFTERFGNPSSLYALGREASRALEDARARVAACLGASSPTELVFTGSGTESDNAGVIGLATAQGRTSGHIIVSAFEHSAVLAPARWLARHGFELTELMSGSDGTVHPEDLAGAMRNDTVLVSVMHANNEIGTVQPIAELAEVAHNASALFHTDAAQSVGKIDIDLCALGVDALSFSAHKLYAPKGLGGLYIRQGVRLPPYLMGGGQESGRRSGTENVAGAVGLATALELMDAERPKETPRLSTLLDRIVTGVLGAVPGTRLTAAEAPMRLPHIANLIIPGVEGESLLLHLDAAGIAVSTGSACHSGSLEPSHVLTAIGVPASDAFGSVRISVGRFTTTQDVELLLEVLPAAVERLHTLNS